MTTLSSENIIKHLAKYRNVIILVALFVFMGVAGASYYFTGRTFKSGVDFYLIKSSIEDTKTDNINSIAFLPKEEIEIIKSIVTSDQLFQFVVRSKKLVNYYHEKFSYDAEEILKAATTITVSEHGKVSILVDDNDNYFAYTIANDMMHKINQLYCEYLKSTMKTQSINCEQQIHHYSVEKNTIMKSLAHYPVMALNLEFADDSLTGPNYIKRLNKTGKQTGMKMEDVVTVLGLFHNLNIVEHQLYAYTDQNQKIQSALNMLDKNHIIITDKVIRFKRSVDIINHFWLGLKMAFLAMIILIVTILTIKIFSKELMLIVRPEN